MQSNHLMVKSDMNYNNYKACKINLSLNIHDTPIFFKVNWLIPLLCKIILCLYVK